jgi:xylose isomerase
MGKRKYAVITGFMGKIQDRFMQYAPEKSFEAMVEISSKIKGCSGIEVVYPQQVTDPVVAKKILDNNGLACAALNVNLKGEEKWLFGSLTSPDPKIRKEAATYIKTGMDIASGLGIKKMTVSFLNDGSDYPFEMDFERGFNDAIEVIREAGSYRPEILLSLEYKHSEPRVHGMFNNAGKMAFFCEKAGLSNVGVTLDTGHALQSGEILSDSLAFLATSKRLFHVHINDNYRNWDWDMVPGTINFWEFVEFCLYIDKVGYTDFMTADVFPARHNAVRIMEKTFEWMDYMFSITDAIRREGDIFAKMNSGADAFEMMDYVRKFLK